MFFYHGSSDRIVTMTTTDPIIKLPAGYEDWVEVAPIVGQISPRRIVGHGSPLARYLGTKVFVRPKPKPVLPDVKPGAVISFKSKLGSARLAILGIIGWRVFEGGTPVVYCGTDWSNPIATSVELLSDVDADGFTVELEGL